MIKRSLYQCFNAKVLSSELYCSKGHPFPLPNPGRIHIRALFRGKPLELVCCQSCPDFDEMGGPVKKEDRGWKPTQEEHDRWRKELK